MRIIKSSVAVFLCFLFYFFFRRDGIIFYSQLAALWCIQPQWENTLNKALQRTVGTMTGAVFGLMVLLIDQNLIPVNRGGEFIYAFLVAATIIAVIYVTLLVHKKDASYFSCVVFLSIVVIHIGDANPYLFVLNRVYDVLVKECDHNKVVRTLKKMYEPLLWDSGNCSTGLSGKNRVC